jgi:hypothetical protein
LAQAVERQQLIDTRARGMNPAQARGSVDYRVRKAGCQQKVDIVQRLREALAIPAEGHFHVVGKLPVPVSREVPRHGVEVKRGSRSNARWPSTTASMYRPALKIIISHS